MKSTLFAGAEVGEDVVEDGISGDLAARDVAEDADGKDRERR
nr:hypothetical protein [uncultured Porphyromonas sp.]